MEIAATNNQQSSTATTAQTASAASEARTVISSDFETFLRMLTTQLENQDPLDPVKSEDFAVQLATFSGVEQQVLTNDLLEALVDANGLSGMGQYANWVGMEARAPVAGNFNGSALTVSPRPDLSSDKAVLIATNEFGAEVQRLEIPVTHEDVDWSGNLGGNQAPNGRYTFTVESYSNGQVTKTEPVEVYTKIEEVQVKNGAAVLIANGGVEVDPDLITALR
jgi:flagellar basal-body rod modification protein FlgD